jgi:hypothetical protein
LRLINEDVGNYGEKSDFVFLRCSQEKSEKVAAAAVDLQAFNHDVTRRHPTEGHHAKSFARDGGRRIPVFQFPLCVLCVSVVNHQASGDPEIRPMS